MASSLRQVAIRSVGWARDSLGFGALDGIAAIRVATHDVVSFSLPPLVLIAVALLVSSLPRVRAARIDPAKSLREGKLGFHSPA
jgi:hypothetical protein